MRDYDAEAEFYHDEFEAGGYSTEQYEDAMRQLDDERNQEARELSGEDSNGA